MGSQYISHLYQYVFTGVMNKTVFDIIFIQKPLFVFCFNEIDVEVHYWRHYLLLSLLKKGREVFLEMKRKVLFTNSDTINSDFAFVIFLQLVHLLLNYNNPFLCLNVPHK